MTSVLVLIYLLATALIIYSQLHAARSFCPWVPTRKRDLDRIRSVAALEKDQKFLDLGCGDGRVVRFLSRHSDAKVAGIELSIPHFIYAKLAGLLSGRRNASIRYGDLLRADLTDVDTVFVYGNPVTLHSKLKPKLERELKPGAKLISYEFPIDGWELHASDRGTAPNHTPLFVYRF